MASEPQQPEVGKYHEACTKHCSTVRNKNPYVHKLFEAMEKSGCSVPEMKCEPCPTIEAAAYYDDKEGIVVCEDRIGGLKIIGSSVVHELIHAYDHCRTQFSMNNCVQVACTEIRAANLSGECHWKREMLRGYGLHIRKHHTACVQRRAEVSLQAVPHCRAHAQVAVQKAWASCFKDLDPFDFIP